MRCTSILVIVTGQNNGHISKLLLEAIASSVFLDNMGVLRNMPSHREKKKDVITHIVGDYYKESETVECEFIAPFKRLLNDVPLQLNLFAVIETVLHGFRITTKTAIQRRPTNIPTTQLCLHGNVSVRSSKKPMCIAKGALEHHYSMSIAESAGIIIIKKTSRGSLLRNNGAT